ncbi:hypothetical protein POSPLADRAFT_1151932 [Postia placenta MAD-698-R-SB12]|uniref:UDENN domain-containing protein n=1 Tax=Postia placenta MAD-698-R-SB12 TaxID=670580 RepID=A0A1X6MQT9_9APHY|nr:hypothetical protein POSPLADRAFT_1151932 [Postia placenta MAD-698-R-SB12]OSX58748.1 hypothetical protein POSPLADRAFT_1151932 [Postia placenta MAD-698-R-SB12]
MYGYSYFTQRRDATSKRGYQQRSLVILSHLAYPALFYTLLSKLGPAFLSHGGPMLEAACHNIATWSDPTAGATLELGFLGSVLQAEIPSNIDTQQAPAKSQLVVKPGMHGIQYQILASLAPPDPPVIDLFGACLSQLWSIWECLVLCEPILVFGPSPAMTSQAIWWLRDVLRPIPVAGDFRPFFTIHDADHAALVNSRPPSSGLILGVTNPYFERACKHWPHVLSLGRAPRSLISLISHKSDASATLGPIPGWKSRTHKRYTSKDQALLRQLQEACNGSEQTRREASALLRQHFSSRTAALLVPLQRYLQSLIPPPTAVSATFPTTTEGQGRAAHPKTSSGARFPKALSASAMFPKSAAASTFPKASVTGTYPKTAAASTHPKTSVATAFASSGSSAFPSPASSTEDDPPTWNPAFPPTPTAGAHPSPATASAPQSAVPSRLHSASEASLTDSALSSTDSLSSPAPSPSPAPTPTSAVPRLAPFSERAFLASLKPVVLPFRSAGRAKEFYARWIRTPAFGVWIARQEEVVEKVLRGV